MATGSSSWDMMQRRPRAKLGGVSLNLGTKSQLVSVEGISDADAEKIMHLRGSSGGTVVHHPTPGNRHHGGTNASVGQR